MNYGFIIDARAGPTRPEHALALRGPYQAGGGADKAPAEPPSGALLTPVPRLG